MSRDEWYRAWRSGQPRQRIVDHRFVTGFIVALCLLFLAAVLIPPFL